MKLLCLGGNEKKNSGKDPNKTKARFAEGNQKINNLKIKLQKCKNHFTKNEVFQFV